MSIKYSDGLWYATTTRDDGTVCLGYAPTIQEAMDFCFELLARRVSANDD
jgi:hypothetical protein